MKPTFARRVYRLAIFVLVFALALPVSFVAHGQQTVRLQVGLRGDPQVWYDLLPSFHAAHPGIVVDFVDQVDWNLDKIIVAELGGQPYDVVYAVIEQAAALADTGLMLPLDEMMAADTGWVADFVDDVHPQLLNMWQFDGQQYFLPYEWNNMVMYYNPRLFNERGLSFPRRGWTWDDFLADAKRLTERGPDNEPIIDGYSCTWYNFFGFGPWIYSAGGQILDESWERSMMDDPRVIEAIEFNRSLIQDHQVMRLGCDPIPETGRVGMWPAGRWVVWWYEYVNVYFDDYDIQAWPVKDQEASMLGGGGHAISAASPNKEAAWAFMEWLNSPDIVAYWARIGDSNPSRTSISMSDAVLGIPPANAMVYYEMLNHSVPVPAPASYPELEAIFGPTLERVWAGDISAEEAVREMHRLMNAELGAAL